MALSADEKRRRAITAWWERKSILDFIARLKRTRMEDEVRAAFDAWAAEHDPDGTMDDYERAKLYSKAIGDRGGNRSRAREQDWSQYVSPHMPLASADTRPEGGDATEIAEGSDAEER